MEGILKNLPRISGVGFVTDDSRIMTRYSLADIMDENSRTMDYNILPIDAESKPKVLAFLKRFFFRDEPLNDYIGLIPDGENSTCPPLEEYSMSSVDENLSLMAVTSSGAIVGVQLNGRAIPPAKDEPDYIEHCESPKFKKILKLLHYVDLKADLVNRYPGKKIIDVRIVSVDNTWRGKGIAASLVEKTIAIAKALNYDYIRSDCSSHFTAKLCKRLGFQPIFQLNYSDYTDESGKPVFQPASPHTAITTYIKKLH